MAVSSALLVILVGATLALGAQVMAAEPGADATHRKMPAGTASTRTPGPPSLKPSAVRVKADPKADPRPGTADAPPGTRGEPFNSCQKRAGGKRTVKVNLKPETKLNDLIAWISSLTCQEFVVSAEIEGRATVVTIFAPDLVTPDEAYRLFLNALDSIGLTVRPLGSFLQIIDTARAKSTDIPVYGWDGRPAQ